MGDMPVGTMTFLFTDIEGLTRLWQDDIDAPGGGPPRPAASGRSERVSTGG
jgi:hypothetical protein